MTPPEDWSVEDMSLDKSTSASLKENPQLNLTPEEVGEDTSASTETKERPVQTDHAAKMDGEWASSTLIDDDDEGACMLSIHDLSGLEMDENPNDIRIVKSSSNENSSLDDIVLNLSQEFTKKIELNTSSDQKKIEKTRSKKIENERSKKIGQQRNEKIGEKKSKEIEAKQVEASSSSMKKIVTKLKYVGTKSKQPAEKMTGEKIGKKKVEYVNVNAKSDDSTETPIVKMPPIKKGKGRPKGSKNKKKTERPLKFNEKSLQVRNQMILESLFGKKNLLKKKVKSSLVNFPRIHHIYQTICMRQKCLILQNILKQKLLRRLLR